MGIYSDALEVDGVRFLLTKTDNQEQQWLVQYNMGELNCFLKDSFLETTNKQKTAQIKPEHAAEFKSHCIYLAWSRVTSARYFVYCIVPKHIKKTVGQSLIYIYIYKTLNTEVNLLLFLFPICFNSCLEA